MTNDKWLMVKRPQRRNANSGFSMIEVLVASTVMVMLMLMLGMLSQQASQAWRTGRQRADVLLKARIFFGVLQRDMSAAVDINTLPKVVQEKVGLNQSFGGTIQFFTLTGTGFEDNKTIQDGAKSLRALTHVTYSATGQRSEVVLLQQPNGGFTKSAPHNTALFNPSLGGSSLVGIKFEAYDANGGSAGSRFPAYITITAQATAATNTFEIGAGSAGPDRVWDTRDDIRTWTDRK